VAWIRSQQVSVALRRQILPYIYVAPVGLGGLAGSLGSLVPVIFVGSVIVTSLPRRSVGLD